VACPCGASRSQILSVLSSFSTWDEPGLQGRVCFFAREAIALISNEKTRAAFFDSNVLKRYAVLILGTENAIGRTAALRSRAKTVAASGRSRGFFFAIDSRKIAGCIQPSLLAALLCKSCKNASGTD
jgi:hypothetical protein